MKIIGKILTEVDVTLYDMIMALDRETISLSTTTDLKSPQLLHVDIEEEDGSMWVKEHRFDQTMSYPVPMKAQKLVKAIKNLKEAYSAYVGG